MLALSFMRKEEVYLSDSTHVTMAVISPSLTVFGVAGIGMVPNAPEPPLRTFFSSFACASLSTAYLRAISFSAGPTDFLSVAWQAWQLLALNAASPPSAANAAVEKVNAAVRVTK